MNSNGPSTKFYYHVARHEMMHLAAAAHSGKNDSMNGDNPATMGTCFDHTDFRTANFLDQDASAQLNWHFSSLANRQATANIGFEQGVNFWGASNGSLWEVSSGGATAPGYAAFDAAGTSANSYIYQTVRLWTGNDSTVEVRGVINGRAPTSAINTNIRAEIYHRSLSEAGSANGCDYPRGIGNPNNPTSTPNYIQLAESDTTNVGTTWDFVATPWYAMTAVHDGHQLQVRAYGNASGSAVRFDNVRAEER